MTRLLKIAPVFAILLAVAAPAMAQSASWNLTYDRTTDVMTFTVDGTALKYQKTLGGLSQFSVRAYASDKDSGIRVDDGTLDGKDVNGGLLFDVSTDPGLTMMSWSGEMTGRPGLAIQIDVVPMMPAYTFDYVTWGELKDLFIRR